MRKVMVMFSHLFQNSEVISVNCIVIPTTYSDDLTRCRYHNVVWNTHAQYNILSTMANVQACICIGFYFRIIPKRQRKRKRVTHPSTEDVDDRVLRDQIFERKVERRSGNFGAFLYEMKLLLINVSSLFLHDSI